MDAASSFRVSEHESRRSDATQQQCLTDTTLVKGHELRVTDESIVRSISDKAILRASPFACASVCGLRVQRKFGGPRVALCCNVVQTNGANRIATLGSKYIRRGVDRMKEHAALTKEKGTSACSGQVLIPYNVFLGRFQRTCPMAPPKSRRV